MQQQHKPKQDQPDSFATSYESEYDSEENDQKDPSLTESYSSEVDRRVQKDFMDRSMELKRKQKQA